MSAEASSYADDFLAPYRIRSLPSSFYYIPDFITHEEEESLLRKIPANRWTHLSHRRLQAHPSTLAPNNVLLASALPPWLVHPVRPRFEKLGVFKHTPHGEPNHVLVNEYLPGEGIMPHEDGAAYAPVVATVSLGGSIVLDIYRKRESEQEARAKIVREGEDEAEAAAGPGMDNTVPSTSGSKADFHRPVHRILQEPGSLLITMGTAYTDLMHGISPVTTDVELAGDTIANWELLRDPSRFTDGRNERTTRVSLTYRDVLKVSRMANKIFGLGRR